MHFEASYETRTSRSRNRASSLSPLRSSLKRSSSFSSSSPNIIPLGGYMAPAPAPPPAPAPWVHGATRITYPPLAYPSSSSSYTNTAVATYNPNTNMYNPASAKAPSSSYIFNATKTTEREYTPIYAPAPPSPRPLENPEVKAAIAHEQNLRMLSEQSHQETLKRHILEIEIAKTAVQRNKVRQEEEARTRMQRLYMLSQEQHQQQMVLMDAARAAEEAHHRYHHHHQGRSRSRHSRSRGRARSTSRSREIEYDEHRRSTHICGRCHHKGHYSKECHNNHHSTHRHSSSTLLLESGPRSSAPALLGPGSSRGRRSRRGSTVCSSDNEYAVDSEEEEGWLSDEYEQSSREMGRVVPADSGVLVMYAPGGGPATRTSSIRHVVGV